VSIKKKLVTAITTAGLLAGLFGSAFVPVARAAADDATAAAACTSSDHTSTVVSGAQTCYYVSSVKPSIAVTVTASGAGDDLGTYTFKATGTTFYTALAVTYGATGAGTTTLNNNVDTVRVNATTLANNDTIIFTVVLNTITAGSSATVTITDDDSTPLTLTISSLSAAKAGISTKYTSVAADQTTTRTLSDDVTAANTVAGQPKAATVVM